MQESSQTVWRDSTNDRYKSTAEYSKQTPNWDDERGSHDNTRNTRYGKKKMEGDNSCC